MLPRCLTPFALAGLIALASCAAGSSHLEGQVSMTAITFARGAVLGNRIANDTAVGRGTLSRARADCVEAYQDKKYPQAFQQLLDDALTAGEMRASDDFWSSEAGRKWAEQVLRRLTRAIGSALPGTEVQLSKEETQQVEDFKASSAGRKIVGEKLMLSSAALTASMSVVLESRRACPS